MPISESISALEDRVRARHLLLPQNTFQRIAMRIQVIADEVSGLVGKRVIDLGCGSEKSLDGPKGWFNKRRLKKNSPDSYVAFHPWYCRILHEAGAHAIGIDIADNKKEAFESHRLDLSDPKTLTMFDDASIDHVNSEMFIAPSDGMFRKGVSPSLLTQLWLKKDVASKRRRESLGWELDMPFSDEAHQPVWDLNDQLFEQVSRLLKEGGAYTLGELVYRKQDGVLQRDDAASFIV